MQQIKEDSQKNRQAELRRNKELAQLKKEQRAKDKLISTLETDKHKRDIVLRRKQEEVTNFIIFRYNQIFEEENIVIFIIELASLCITRNSIFVAPTFWTLYLIIKRSLRFMWLGTGVKFETRTVGKPVW